VTGTRSKQISKFIVAAAKSAADDTFLHWTIPAFDPAMILFNSIVQVPAAAMSDRLSELLANRTRIAIMSISRYARWRDTGDRFGRTKKPFRRFHVPLFAQHNVHQRAGPADRAIGVAPSAMNRGT
jgi:hypothetical protein